jgi:hypothetical protein
MLIKIVELITIACRKKIYVSYLFVLVGLSAIISGVRLARENQPQIPPSVRASSTGYLFVPVRSLLKLCVISNCMHQCLFSALHRAVCTNYLEADLYARSSAPVQFFPMQRSPV